MYPIFVVLLDGLADRAHESLGGRTANEVADTPNLDRFAAGGSCGLLYAVGPGRAPSSEIAHWAMLGYAPEEFPGRAVFEALGDGQELDDGHVFSFAALRPADRRADGLWLTGRPRRSEDEDDAAELVAACADLEIDGLRFELTHLRRGECVLRVFPGADDRVTDTDAFFRDRHPVLRPQAQVPEAEQTARAAEAWTRQTLEILAAHAVNERRTAEGHPALNVITLKWWGRPRPAPTFSQRHGVHGSFLGDSKFLLGLARAVGLEPRYVPETDDSPADLRARLELANERLAEGDTFVFAHLKATDMAGHTKDPQVKKRTIEALDAELGSLPTDRAIVCVTGDHATPTYPDVIHSGDPVPFLVAGPGVRADAVQRFGELDCAAGILGQLRGPDMMPVLLNAADRPLFLGSRPTPFPGADGYPSSSSPFFSISRVEASTARSRIGSLELSPARFLQLAVANAAGLWLIVGSGAAVRLTDSGLGCRHWPGCERGQPLPARDVHAFVEFGNRLVGGVVIALTLITFLAAWLTPGLVRWARRVALLVFLGALTQAPLGYLAVASDLRWPVVMAHLLLSIVLLAGAVVLVVEAFGLRDGRSPPIVPRELRLLALLFTAAGFVLIVSGTFATAAGPHSGGGEHIDRFGSFDRSVYLHGAVVGLFLLSFLFAIGYLAAFRDRSRALFGLGLAVLALLLVQMGIGEVQWRTKLPWEVVLVHVVLAAAVWAGTVALAALFFRPPRSLLSGQHLH